MICLSNYIFYYIFFTLDKEEYLEELSKVDEILMEAYKYLKSLSHDSIPMSKLDEQELDEYCQRLALWMLKKKDK